MKTKPAETPDRLEALVALLWARYPEAPQQIPRPSHLVVLEVGSHLNDKVEGERHLDDKDAPLSDPHLTLIHE